MVQRYYLDKRAPGMFRHATGGWVKYRDHLRDLEKLVAYVERLKKDTRPLCHWTDFAGQPIHAGDRMRHPNGTEFTVVFWPNEADVGDRWRACYDGNTLVSRLGLQIGDRGMAVVIKPQEALRFPSVSCSHCGFSFGPGEAGFSHCEDHAHLKGTPP